MRLGVGAPGTAKRATLQEYESANPRPVVQRETLNVEDAPCSHLETVFGPPNDVFLNVAVQLDEIGAVACYANQKIGIL